MQLVQTRMWLPRVLPTLLQPRVQQEMQLVQTRKEAAKSALNTAAAKSAAGNAASGEKKVAANTRAEKKKMTENKKQPKQKGVTPAWTQANPHYEYGQPMLTAAQLESAGPATNALHRYYMKGCVAKQIDVVI